MLHNIIFQFFCMSLPEAILDISFGIIACGIMETLPIGYNYDKGADESTSLIFIMKRFPCEKIIILRFILSILSMAVITTIISLLVPIAPIKTGISILIIILALRVILFSGLFDGYKSGYPEPWKRAFNMGLAILFFNISVEVLVTPIVLYYENKDYLTLINTTELFKQFLYSIPIRILQLTTILSMWNWERSKFNLDVSVGRKNYILLASIIAYVELNYFYLYFISFLILPSWAKINGFLSCILIGIINYKLMYTFNLCVKVTRKIIWFWFAEVVGKRILKAFCNDNKEGEQVNGYRKYIPRLLNIRKIFVNEHVDELMTIVEKEGKE